VKVSICRCSYTYLTRRQAHDGLAILEHSKEASLHNIKSVAWLTLVDDARLLREDNLLEDVTQLAARGVAELLE
jgi:hypothetical protein